MAHATAEILLANSSEKGSEDQQPPEVWLINIPFTYIAASSSRVGVLLSVPVKLSHIVRAVSKSAGSVVIVFADFTDF